MRGDSSSLAGKRFGRWDVIEGAGKDKRNNTLWLCKCDCGRERSVRRGHLTSGESVSCGCYQKEINGSWSIRHGMTDTPTHKTWNAMLGRCNRPNNASFKSYGERGIKVCDRWLVFENFLSDMGIRPDGHQIDRIDVNGDYEPLNCQWVTPAQNAQNRRNNKLDSGKVNEIRRLYTSSNISQMKLGRLYNVSGSVVGAIVTGKIWKNV